MRKYDGYLKSGEVAKLIGVSKSTIKNWDNKMIFKSDKQTENNIRLYKPESVIKFMKQSIIVGG